jgi:hypothetical protein
MTRQQRGTCGQPLTDNAQQIPEGSTSVTVANPFCVVNGCQKPAPDTTYCQMHRARFRRGTQEDGPFTHASPIVRFWRQVDKRGPGDCWEWTGSKRGSTWPGHGRYGQLSIGTYGRVSAHRYSYELHHGAIPSGLEIAHTCDNPPCVNPAHLRAMTHAENMADMVAKGRMRNA